MKSKPLKFYSTTNVNQHYRNVLPILILSIKECFEANDYDMFILNPNGCKTEILISGYSFTTGELKEGHFVRKLDLNISETIWFKIDDYGDYFLGTFLYPSEY